MEPLTEECDAFGNGLSRIALVIVILISLKLLSNLKTLHYLFYIYSLRFSSNK